MPLDSTTLGLATLVVTNIIAILRHNQITTIKFKGLEKFIGAKFLVVDARFDGVNKRLELLEK